MIHCGQPVRGPGPMPSQGRDSLANRIAAPSWPMPFCYALINGRANLRFAGHFCTRPGLKQARELATKRGQRRSQAIGHRTALAQRPSRVAARGAQKFLLPGRKPGQPLHISAHLPQFRAQHRARTAHLRPVLRLRRCCKHCECREHRQCAAHRECCAGGAFDRGVSNRYASSRSAQSSWSAPAATGHPESLPHEDCGTRPVSPNTLWAVTVPAISSSACAAPSEAVPPTDRSPLKTNAPPLTVPVAVRSPATSRSTPTKRVPSTRAAPLTIRPTRVVSPKTR